MKFLHTLNKRLLSLVELPIMQDGSPTPRLNQRRTLRLAWITLITAFTIFCTLVVAAAYSTWHYRVTATDTQSSELIVRAPEAFEELVTWRRKNRTSFERARDRQMLSEGDEVRIARSAGYGQTATIRLFDNSTLDMWAGADLLLLQMQTSRWSNHDQTVMLEQKAGYVRYDLRADQPYEQVRFVIRANQSTIYLTPGGSYSIDLVPSERQVHFAGTNGRKPLFVDVAVRSGQARIESHNLDRSIAAGHRVIIDPGGIPSEPIPALWQLIRDGDFSTYTEEEYNNTTIITDQPTLIRSDTWQVNSGSTALDADATGFFKIADGCQPPHKDTDCAPQDQTTIAWFLRSDGQTKPFVTGVYQLLGSNGDGIDISEYRSLIFSLWVRILNQSVELAGDDGTECPVMIRFLTRQNSPADPDQERVICFYTSDDPSQLPERSPGITYYRVPKFEWYQLRIDLRNEDWLPEARYMRSIEIYANGHNYNSRVTGVSLLGSHYATPGMFKTDAISHNQWQPPFIPLR